MKTVLVILLGGIPLISFAQVKVNLSFDKETKTIYLKLCNKYNASVILTPISESRLETGTYYDITMKDINDKVIQKCSEYVFRQDRPTKNDISIQTLESKDYKLNLTRWGEKPIFSIEIRVHIEARNSFRKIHYTNDVIKKKYGSRFALYLSEI